MGTGIAPTRIATGHFRVSMSEQFATNVATEDSRSEFEVLSLPYCTHVPTKQKCNLERFTARAFAALPHMLLTSSLNL